MEAATLCGEFGLDPLGYDRVWIDLVNSPRGRAPKLVATLARQAIPRRASAA